MVPLALATFASTALAIPDVVAVTPLSTLEIRKNLGGGVCGTCQLTAKLTGRPLPSRRGGRVFLTAAGRRAFRAFHEILADPASGDAVIYSILGFLRETPTDPGEFAPDAVALLRHHDQGVREKALELLARVARPEHAKLVLPHLEESSVATANALEVLDKVAGPDELKALVDWYTANFPTLDVHSRTRAERTIWRVQTRIVSGTAGQK